MGKQVLVIEDEKSLSQALTDKCHLVGVEVNVAHNGEDGLAMALEKHPDLIVLDMILPKMDGLEVLQNLREDEWGKHVQVIVLSNLNDISRIQKALEKNVFDYIVKSDTKIEEIARKIKEKLSK